jgi:NADH-quinone oxidoreductase subunit E
MLSDKAKTEIKTLMAKYPDKRSAIMPALHLAQREVGWLPDEVVQDIADVIGLSKTEVGSVASFYTMYAREKVGEHTVFFCTDLPCALRGADEMMEHIEHKLGCKAGQTSADGKVTLRDAECLGGCDHAPVMLIDGAEHQQDLTNEKIDEILDRLTKGK